MSTQRGGEAGSARTGPASAGAGGPPLRALHLHSGNLYGGVETILATIARRQREVPGVTHGFALCFPGRCADELAAAGAAVSHLGAVRVSRPWTVLAARRRLAALLRESRPDVAVTHSPWAHAVLAPTARRVGIPLVHWRHGAGDPRHWLDRRARRTPPDLVVAASRFAARSAMPAFPGVRVRFLYAPVDAAGGGRDAAAGASERVLRDDVRAALGTPLDVALLVQVSRMEEGKGHPVLVDALGTLQARRDWECWVVGRAQRPSEAAYEQHLRERVAALGLEGRVRFLGERDDVPALLAAADVCCQPDVAPEAFGMVFVEALARGVPVVTSAIGAAPEVVDHSCGVLVPPADAPALAAALDGLLDAPGLRRTLGAAGPARAAALSDPARQLARLGDLLRTAAGREVRAPEGPRP